MAGPTGPWATISGALHFLDHVTEREGTPEASMAFPSTPMYRAHALDILPYETREFPPVAGVILRADAFLLGDSCHGS